MPATATGLHEAIPRHFIAMAPGVANGAEIRYPGMGGRSRGRTERGISTFALLLYPDSSTPVFASQIPGGGGRGTDPKGDLGGPQVSAVGEVVPRGDLSLFAAGETATPQ